MTYFENEKSHRQETLQLSIDSIQLDHQVFKTKFPIVFSPSPVPENMKQPFIQLSVNKKNLKTCPCISFNMSRF
eukprot:TRINITY_DN8074_c0_g1_i1.p1 TRINITY_DN8074_c0_g1~~TRINITY_DN8074_c0_g1_i1.p1  ORF type:complete len:74 (-),score=3.30 TRINITY_DN8074_c0_g1_i1:28-249(-)